jgi:hypothetical protein
MDPQLHFYEWEATKWNVTNSTRDTLRDVTDNPTSDAFPDETPEWIPHTKI